MKDPGICSIEHHYIFTHHMVYLNVLKSVPCIVHANIHDAEFVDFHIIESYNHRFIKVEKDH